MERRAFLKGLAGVTVLAVAGGVYRAVDQGVFSVGTGAAYEPWHTWDDDSASGPLALVRAAILAANPHNTQPWIFSVYDDRIDLYADPSRHLGAMDAFGRELHIGLGCAIENLVLSAAAAGVDAEVTTAQGHTNIDGLDAPELVASIDLSQAGGSASYLHAEIPNRHTNRGPYDPSRAIRQTSLDGFIGLLANSPEVRLDFVSDGERLGAVGETITAATSAIIADHDMVMASEEWFRHDWDDLQQHKDGVTLDSAGGSSFMTAMGKMLPRLDARTNHDFWLSATRDVHTATAAAYGIISVRDLYDRAANMDAGRVWQRLHLHAAKVGIAMQPLNQPLEIVDQMKSLGGDAPDAIRLDRFVEEGWYPTFCFRMGYAQMTARPSPRRGLTDVVRST